MPLTQSGVTSSSSSSSSASSTSLSRISVYNDISVMHSTLSNSRAVKEKFKEMLRLSNRSLGNNDSDSLGQYYNANDDVFVSKFDRYSSNKKIDKSTDRTEGGIV